MLAMTVVTLKINWINQFGIRGKVGENVVPTREKIQPRQAIPCPQMEISLMRHCLPQLQEPCQLLLQTTLPPQVQYMIYTYHLDDHGLCILRVPSCMGFFGTYTICFVGYIICTLTPSSTLCHLLCVIYFDLCSPYVASEMTSSKLVPKNTKFSKKYKRAWPFHFRDCKSGSIRMTFFDFGVDFFLGISKWLWRFIFIT
jgi:hypothetical protein